MEISPQERKKSTIVIASILKPVDDTRMSEKIGLSLSRLYNVHVVGYPTTAQEADGRLTTYPLERFKRISLERIRSRLRILFYILRAKPALLIITTHELLGASILSKWLTGCRIIYDVQENYLRNIVHTKTFPWGIRHIIAALVRLKEWVTRPLIDHFFLAEKAYADEMHFPKQRTTILENKYQGASLARVRQKHDDKTIRLLFSGTLSESTGVFNAIKIADALYHVDHRIRLTITGYCALDREYKRLMSEVSSKPFINLKGGDTLVPHKNIIEEIALSDFGIVSYPDNPSTRNSTPTKLYEYLANVLPILLINNPAWVTRCEPFPAAIPFDIENFPAEEVLRRMTNDHFYVRQPLDATWSSEEVKLLAVVAELI